MTDVDVVWGGTVDQGRFVVAVIRKTATTATLRVSLQETEEEILNEPVGLAWGAVFGPDIDDVALWQARVIEAIDAWIEAHP